MKVVFLILLGAHGLIHLIGHYNAYHPGKIEGVTLPVSRGLGFIWLLTACIISTAVGLSAFNLDLWWFFGVVGLILSQFLIIYFWQDARFGTIGNLLLLFGLVVGYANWNFKKVYLDDVNAGLSRTTILKPEVVTEQDLAHLPQVVKKYLRYTGVPGKPKVDNFRVKMKAEFRNEESNWFKMRTEQYNFFDNYERHFFLQAKKNGIGIRGYHDYQNGEASMSIKLLSLFPVTELAGKEMFISETVTLFNDMCILAPATLIDNHIEWEVIDNLTVRAKFTNDQTTISAVLYFDKTGQLVNFVSDDRYEASRMEQVRFSTPISNYKDFNGYRLASYGETIWHFPEGDFTYGKFRISTIEYNVKRMNLLK